MAYDFGSQTLGIKNPFKLEGLTKLISGLVVFAAGVIVLLGVADNLQQSNIAGWGNAIIGFLLVTLGARHAGVGIFQLFRYFVGRSVPTSLAYNRSVSEQDVAEHEAPAVLYTDKQLHSMLMGRKNMTFLEPKGWVGRLVHSLFPKLTFMPYPLRNLAQELSSITISVITGLIAFAVAAFVVSTGLAGAASKILAMPLLSVLLLVFLLISWRATAKAVSNNGQTLLSSNNLSFGALIALAILVPVILGNFLDSMLSTRQMDQLLQFASKFSLFSAWTNLSIFAVTLLVVLGVTLPLLKKRASATTPSSEVSEYRDNLQESIHPNELFINIENIVLANRRYKEVPNRVYRAFDPKLNEQSEGKGSFAGELILETQPELANQNDTHQNKGLKSALTLVSEVMFLATVAAFAWFAFQIMDTAQVFTNMPRKVSEQDVLNAVSLINTCLLGLFLWLTLAAAGRILAKASHLFWGEIQFNSLLMFLKTEGTYTESKISTGMSIHDSTRSENVVVRSSITPWIITSRVTTSIFATSGLKNLEAPRFIMGMHKNDQELDGIVSEIKHFLKQRETIASITNEKDLANAGQIYQVNEQSRALPAAEQTARLSVEEQAAGALRDNTVEQ